jgi:hypothetical protein
MKQRVITFSVTKWLSSIIGRGIVIVAFSLPLMILKQSGTIDLNLWLRFISIGAVSFIWTVGLIWMIGLTNNERDFLVTKVKNVVRIR